MSSNKTSKRTNTNTHKGHTRKNGGTRQSINFNNLRKGLFESSTEEYVKYFYKGRHLAGLPVKFLAMSFEELANKSIREYLEKGKNLKEIIDIFTKNLKKKSGQILKCEFLNNISPGFGLSETFGIDTKEFLIDWNNSVAVLIKLKALENDDQNGKLSYRSNAELEAKR